MIVPAESVNPVFDRFKVSNLDVVKQSAKH